MSNLYGIRSICGRIVIRLGYEGGVTISEMTLIEAKAARAALDKAIEYLEAGDTMAPDFGSFMDAIHAAWPPAET